MAIGSLCRGREAFRLAQPIGHPVPSGENLGHQPSLMNAGEGCRAEAAILRRRAKPSTAPTDRLRKLLPSSNARRNSGPFRDSLSRHQVCYECGSWPGDKRFVYVLTTTDDKPHFYVGLTSDVTARLTDHNAGRCPHTVSRRPWMLHVVVEFSDEQRAVRFERYLKSGSGRACARRHIAEPEIPDWSRDQLRLSRRDRCESAAARG